jgi:integrase
VFRGKRGPYTARGIEYLVAEIGQRAQVPNVHPHRFRHDTARRMVESVDLPTVAAWLGHERLDTVRIYSQPDEAALEQAAAALEARRSGHRQGHVTQRPGRISSLVPLRLMRRDSDFVQAARTR